MFRIGNAARFFNNEPFHHPSMGTSILLATEQLEQGGARRTFGFGMGPREGHFSPSIPCQILSLAGADRVRRRSNCTANRDMMARIAGNLLGTIDRLRSTGQTHGWSQKFPHLMETRSPKPRRETSQRAGTRSHTLSMSKSQRKAFIAGSPADGSNLLRSGLIDQHENFEKQTTKSNPTTCTPRRRGREGMCGG